MQTFKLNLIYEILKGLGVSDINIFKLLFSFGNKLMAQSFGFCTDNGGNFHQNKKRKCQF